MKNRIKNIRKFKKMSQAELAQILNVDQTAISNWENEKNNIDIEIAKIISEKFKFPLEYIYGYPYTLARPREEWDSDEIEDIDEADFYAADVLRFRYGQGKFNSEFKPIKGEEYRRAAQYTPLPPEGMTRVTIHGRDGQTEYADFTQEQMELIRAMIKAKNDQK